MSLREHGPSWITPPSLLSANSFTLPAFRVNYVHVRKKRGSPVVRAVKNLPASAGDTRDTGSIPGWGRSPGEGNGNLHQYSGLEDSTDCVVHGIARSQIQLSGFHFTMYTQTYIHTHTHIHTQQFSFSLPMSWLPHCQSLKHKTESLLLWIWSPSSITAFECLLNCIAISSSELPVTGRIQVKSGQCFWCIWTKLP